MSIEGVENDAQVLTTPRVLTNRTHLFILHSALVLGLLGVTELSVPTVGASARPEGQPQEHPLRQQRFECVVVPRRAEEHQMRCTLHHTPLEASADGCRKHTKSE